MRLVGLLLVVVYEIIHTKRSNKRKGNMSMYVHALLSLLCPQQDYLVKISKTYDVKLFIAFYNFTYKVIYFENCYLRSVLPM